MKILLAEDNAIVRKAVAAGLMADGYDVDLAEDGERALSIAHDSHPDLILSDVLMPNMDGFTLCQAVRDDEQLHDVPVVFYSSTFLDPEDAALAHEVGASGFILKDEDPETFRHRIHDIIESESKHGLPDFNNSPAHLSETNHLYRKTLVGKLHKKVSELEEEKRALHESRQFLDHIVTTIPDVIFVLSLPELGLSYIAPQAEKLLGFSGDVLLQDRHAWRSLIDEAELMRIEQELRRAIAKDDSTIITCRMRHRQGGMRWIEGRVSPRTNANGEVIELVGSLTDVTQRYVAEEQLIQSEQRFRSLFEMMESGMSVHELIYDENGEANDYRFIDINPAFERLTGLTTDAVIGRSVREALPGIEEEWIRDYIQVAQSGIPKAFVRYAAPLNRYYQVVAYQTQKDQFATVFNDISEQKRAEEEVKSLARLASENPSPVIRIAESGDVLYQNTAGEELLAFCNTYKAGLCEELVSKAKQALQQDAQESVDYAVDGRYYAFVVTPVKEWGYANLYGRDITERMQATQQLKRTNRVLRTLSLGNRTMVHATSEDELVHSVCQVLAEEGGYPYVWTAYTDDAKHLKPRASYGSYSEQMRLWQDDLERLDLHHEVFSGLFDDANPLLVADQQDGVWTNQQVEIVNREGLSNLLLLPLLHRQRLFGVIGIFSFTQDVFDSTELHLLQEMAGDVSYGIHAHRIHEAHEKSMQRIQSTMFQTIEAISRTLEKRDPYTAGHQQRVMQLAVAIGQEMGYSEQRIEGLRLAAQVHDIGKIHVPAEILNRPGRLSSSEFGIIKSHPQVGFEILQGVEFDWPIAEIVLQHHERCDGSGYPQGLKGEEIIPEARILAVADVVEAITSHRPYRASLGIEVALDEIEKGRDLVYSGDVVDTCLRLFREKGFAWE